MLTKLTRHWCIQKKRRRLYYLQWTTEESGILTLHQSDRDDSASAWWCIISLGRHITRGELGAHTSRTSGVNYAGFQCRMAWGSAALYHRAIHLPPQVGCLPPPGRCYWSDSALLCIVTISLRVFLFFCFGERENALLSIFLCLCILKMSVQSIRLVKSLCPESLCLIRSRCLSWL